MKWAVHHHLYPVPIIKYGGIHEQLHFRNRLVQVSGGLGALKATKHSEEQECQYLRLLRHVLPCHNTAEEIRQVHYDLPVQPTTV